VTYRGSVVFGRTPYIQDAHLPCLGAEYCGAAFSGF
jgi:hypothetical protein